MNMQLIYFDEIASSLGMDESAARISMATPAVNEDVLQYRAFCIAELIINRLIKDGQLKNITRNSWGEVRRCFTVSKETVVALIQLNGSPQIFPLEIPIQALAGHKDSIVQSVRSLERDVPIRLKAWCNVTKHGMLQFQSSQVLLQQMMKFHQRLVS
ncbi:hypothetical protein ACFPOG_12570 [Paenibacillus aestuarii]|uniref:Uncharacterized protein n=1 Tax=Paenibacillus aestuarii TaxID=516965 RepID=A0ABW0K705_9BACL